MEGTALGRRDVVEVLGLLEDVAGTQPDPCFDVVFALVDALEERLGEGDCCQGAVAQEGEEFGGG